MSREPNNSADSLSDEADAQDLARWEQSFRDARPTLPQTSMARIEQTVRQESEKIALAQSKPPTLLLWLALLTIAATTLTLLVYYRRPATLPAVSPPVVVPVVHDDFPLDLPIEPLEVQNYKPAPGPRPLINASVQALSKSVNEGVATYSGSVLLSAGPWRINCDTLTVFRSGGHSALLTGMGNVRISGVSEISRARSDELTLNTETCELKLSGHVRLAGTQFAADQTLSACTINRFGTVLKKEP